MDTWSPVGDPFPVTAAAEHAEQLPDGQATGWLIALGRDGGRNRVLVVNADGAAQELDLSAVRFDITTWAAEQGPELGGAAVERLDRSMEAVPTG